MADIVLLLWEHCITLISKGMCQDERVPLCLLSAVENGQEGGGRRGVFIKSQGREGTAGAPELSPAPPPSSQASSGGTHAFCGHTWWWTNSLGAENLHHSKL